MSTTYRGDMVGFSTVFCLSDIVADSQIQGPFRWRFSRSYLGYLFSEGRQVFRREHG